MRTRSSPIYHVVHQVPNDSCHNPPIWDKDREAKLGLLMHYTRRCNSTARISAFHAEYKGSIPFTDSIALIAQMVRAWNS